MTARKVVPMKKKFQPNIALFIFLIIIIYVIVLGWNYLTKEHISIYEVNTTEISDDAPLYGFILRSEEVVNTEQEGYINYYNAEGTRIGVGDVVYTVDQSGEVNSMLEQLQSQGTATESISSMREVIASFQNSFSMSSYSRVSDFKFSVNNVIFEQSKGQLFSDLNKAMKSSGKGQEFTRVKAKKSGVISYSVDGYEEMKQKDITAELMDQYGIETRQQLQSSESVKAGSPVYKLVTKNDWSLVVKLDDVYYEQLKEMSTVRVTIEKDDISFNASVILFEQDGMHFARLSTARFMERYINDRFLELEFHLKSATGLKIPNSSVLTKDFYVVPSKFVSTRGGEKGVVRQKVNEAGNTVTEFVPLGDNLSLEDFYYINTSVLHGSDVLVDEQFKETHVVSSTEALPGVYCVNQGFCQFRPIDVLYQNKEYTIVSDTTSGGLSAYDHIVVDPTRLNDDDFIE
ncbi:MAG: hypothetical protein J1F02_07025 [Lachnospiraceae bacterium]|nr:hypothetical protein [Lachnospiraceae bacterium]